MCLPFPFDFRSQALDVSPDRCDREGSTSAAIRSRESLASAAFAHLICLPASALVIRVRPVYPLQLRDNDAHRLRLLE
jgi:hypothetical protein